MRKGFSICTILIMASLAFAAQGQSFTNTYYFPHLALGGGWQTVLTYVNYSQQAVTCQTNFLFDDGTPLAVPFGGPASPTRLDMLAPGGSIHLLSTADPSAVGGWAQGQCTGPVKASMLFRWYNQGAAITEAGVNATTILATRFVTYAQSLTGIAYANPYTYSANLTVTVYNAAGSVVGTPHNVTLPPGGHQAENIGTWLGQSFTGSVEITSFGRRATPRPVFFHKPFAFCGAASGGRCSFSCSTQPPRRRP